MDWQPMELEDFSPFEADLEEEGPDLETSGLPAAAVHRRRPRRRLFRRALQEEAIAEIVPDLPEPGESIHIVANGRYDFWLYVPHLLELLGVPAQGRFSTWTMNRGNVLELLELYDHGRLLSVLMFTGLYFKRRESAVYATLLEGLQERGQRYLAFKNHTKLILLEGGGHHLVVEGSANFTANPRVEQYVFTNDEALHAFHASWMEELAGGRRG